MKRKLALVMTCLMICTALFGCGNSNVPAGTTGSDVGSSDETTVAVGSDTFTFALERDISTLDPANSYNQATNYVNRQMVESLTKYDENKDIVGCLAKDYSISDDGLVYTFNLRDDVTFWDGTKMTAEDAKYSLERVSDEELASSLAWMNSSIDRIETDGDYTLVVTLKYADPDWIYYTAFSTCAVYSKAYCEAHSDDFGTAAGGIMATGPYMYKEWVEGESVTLTKNDNYWNKEAEPQFDTLKFVIMQDKATLISALKTGEIDACFTLAVSDLESIADADNIKTFNVDIEKTQIMFLNTTSGALADVNCRRALASCWDAAGYVDNVWGDAAIQGDELVIPPSMRDSKDPECQKLWDDYYASAPKYEYNLDKAKEYLAQSNAPDGFDMTITVSSADPTDETAALYLQSTASQIGININVEMVTPSERTAMMFSADRTYDAIIVGWDADCSDPGSYVYTIDTISNIGDGGCNMSAYSNEEVDKLLNNIMTYNDEYGRTEELTKALGQIADDCVTINMCYPKRICAMSTSVDGDHYDELYTTSSAWMNYMYRVK